MSLPLVSKCLGLLFLLLFFTFFYLNQVKVPFFLSEELLISALAILTPVCFPHFGSSTLALLKKNQQWIF